MQYMYMILLSDVAVGSIWHTTNTTITTINYIENMEQGDMDDNAESFHCTH